MSIQKLAKPKTKRLRAAPTTKAKAVFNLSRPGLAEREEKKTLQNRSQYKNISGNNTAFMQKQTQELQSNHDTTNAFAAIAPAIAYGVIDNVADSHAADATNADSAIGGASGNAYGDAYGDDGGDGGD